MTLRIHPDLESLAFPVAMLETLPGNPRKGDVAAIARSYAMFGQRKPIVGRREGDGGIVLAGNHQLLAARELGWESIAIVWVDDDDLKAKAFALADNHVAELGEYDTDLLADMLNYVAVDADLLAATGYTEADLGVGRPGNTDPDDVPEAPPSTTVPGDVWLCGPHRVMCGDSTVPTDVEKLMAGDKADIVWTDPPYGVSYIGKTKNALTIQNDGNIDTERVLDGAVASILQAARPGAPVYVSAPAGPTSHVFASALFDAGLWRQRLIWLKSAMVLGHSDYHYKHEDIYFGYVPGAEGRLGRGGSGWYGSNAETSVLEYDKPSRSDVHPTMKPVGLIAYCLTNSSKVGDIVLDLFGGSGSTLIAAIGLGRLARLMECDPTYCDIICRHYQDYTGQLPVAESTGQLHDFTEVGDDASRGSRQPARSSN